MAVTDSQKLRQAFEIMNNYVTNNTRLKIPEKRRDMGRPGQDPRWDAIKTLHRTFFNAGPPEYCQG
jgi:hypothetical protein